jgi:hypothetical protein
MQITFAFEATLYPLAGRALKAERFSIPARVPPRLN